MVSVPVLFLSFVLLGTVAGHLNHTIPELLEMIPECGKTCVVNTVFVQHGCSMSDIESLAACACPDIPLQTELSACVQKSCAFVKQQDVSKVANHVCEGYPKESRSSELKIGAICSIALSIPFLLLRLLSRWLKTRRFWADDAYAIVAGVFLVATAATILPMSLMGFGTHYWNVTPHDGMKLLKLFYAIQMGYVLVQVFSKVAILALYLRLFPNFIRWFHRTVKILILFMWIHGVGFMLAVVFQCWPIAALWDKTVPGRCINITAGIGFAGAGLSILEDFVILFLPIPELWKLQMSTRKKVGVILLFSIGSFASITSCVRLKYMLKYANTYDSTWDNVDVIKWSLIEILSACICGNIMSLRPLFEYIWPSMRRGVQKVSSFSDWKSPISIHISNSDSSDSSNSSESRAYSDLKRPLPVIIRPRSRSFDWKENSNVVLSPMSAEEGRGLISPVAQSRNMSTSTMLDSSRGQSRNMSTTSMLDSSRENSRPASERRLAVRNEEFGLWTRAFTIFDRRS